MARAERRKPQIGASPAALNMMMMGNVFDLAVFHYIFSNKEWLAYLYWRMLQVQIYQV